jgi:tungstate transport system ATP-binding protein
MSPSSQEAILTAHDLSVSYGKHRVLDIPHLEIVPNQVLSIIGPNGSGKTTLSLCLALLLKPSTGQIAYRNKIIKNNSSAMDIRRHFAVVFQEPLLLNASVWDNVTLGLRLRGAPGPEIKKKAEHWLERFGILSLAQRSARTLSGGEAQRASLARAFILAPEILFLDEPFAALDVPTRQSLFGDMINILRETRATTILVTHDRNEAQTFSHRIIMLSQGKIIQEGSPHQIFSTPINEEVAKFVGMENIIEGVVQSNRDSLAEVTVGSQMVEGVSTCLPGGKVNVFIRPEDVTLSLQPLSSSARNTFAGRVTALIPNGPLTRVSLDCGFPLTALITRLSSEEMRLQIGMHLFASFKAAAIHIIAQN